jgi:hypothetical protein
MRPRDRALPEIAMFLFMERVREETVKESSIGAINRPENSPKPKIGILAPVLRVVVIL